MTTDPSENPSDKLPDAAPSGGEPPRGRDGTNGGDNGDGAPPGKQPRRRRRLWPALVWAIAIPMLLVALIGGALYGVVVTERGTAYAWQLAVKMLHGQLEGKLDGGAIATGLHLRDVRWRSLDGSGTDIRIDGIDGKWQLSDKPWRFVIDYLHIGTVDARIAPSKSKAEPTKLPKELRLPLQLAVRDLSVAKLLLHEGGSTSEYSNLLFHGRSDGVHHEASVDRFDTPFGAVTASAKLDGERPFALTGDAGYSGKVNDESVQVRAHLSGSLETLVAELDATGMKLTGHAHVEATPFGDVPLQRATLTFDHVNPQAFAPGAPLADLAVRAQLQPVPHEPGATGFAVQGAVSIVNAKPGSIDKHLLPLIDAHADVQLDAKAQRISNLNVRLVKDATITGGGALTGKRGQFDLKVAKLDLNALQASMRPTQFAGPIGIKLNDDIQSVTLDLNDPKAALRAQGKITLDPARTSFNDVRITSGKGRIDLSGALKKDANSTYNLKATLTDFDPLTLTTQMPARAAAPAAGKGNAKRAKGAPPAPSRKIEARVNGTLTAAGVLGPVFTTKAEFRLGESVYDNLPMTVSGTIQLAGSRILPSRANLSVAGNQVDLQGSFGARGDRLRFNVDAPALDRLGFGLAGVVAAQGDLTGTFEHPNVALDYKADNVAFASNKVGHAQGHAELRDGANGAMVFTTDASNVSAAGVEIDTLTAHLNGTRAKHTLDAAAKGSFEGRPLDLTVAANGKLTDARDGTHWDGTVTRLSNKGTPALNMESPLAVSAGGQRVTLGATRLTLEGAVLDLKSFALDHGRIRSAGTLTGVSVARMLELRQEFTGVQSNLKTDLVFDGNWDFALGDTATGHVEVKRRAGDITLEVGRGFAPVGITDIAARADFSGGNQLNATVHAQASRIGVIDAAAHTTLVPRDGVLTVNEDGPLSGTINANVPSLKTTGGLFGPSYLLDGHLALKLALGGTVAKPNLSGSLVGDGLSATLVDQGVQLKDGVVRIALSENLVEFQQVEFHGATGTLRATGRVRLDNAAPDLTANIVADKLELFASPDRELTMSGSASIANAGAQGGLAINGKFAIDHALFDMPDKAEPHLGDDVVIVRPDGSVASGKPAELGDSNKPVGAFAPRADIDIDLGKKFRFRGQGADVGLGGTISLLSAPNMPLRAVGNVRVTEGSTYTAFGRKLNIENGFFTFNGPVANPGINILAMRRNQQVEAGVQVTGTIQSPVAKLVSEPSVPDNEKLSWLLFGHGTDQGNNLGQQSTMTTALALLGSASGKRIAQEFGLDEFSIGRSEVGLTDPQVVMVSKAINEWLVIGYEQGLQSASNAVKATVNLTRYWSVAAYGGTFQGMDLQYTRRFDRLRW